MWRTEASLEDILAWYYLILNKNKKLCYYGRFKGGISLFFSLSLYCINAFFHFFLFSRLGICARTRSGLACTCSGTRDEHNNIGMCPWEGRTHNIFGIQKKRLQSLNHTAKAPLFLKYPKFAFLGCVIISYLFNVFVWQKNWCRKHHHMFILLLYLYLTLNTTAICLFYPLPICHVRAHPPSFISSAQETVVFHLLSFLLFHNSSTICYSYPKCSSCYFILFYSYNLC